MALRLRDRQIYPGMRPDGKVISISSIAMKWTGLLLTCLSSLGVAVFQRGLLKLDSYADLAGLPEAVAAPSSGVAGLVSMAATCSLISAMAIPLYAKLVYEGWKRIADKRQLLLRLFLCALLSEIPFDLAMSGNLLNPSVQDPVWGLLLCAAMLEVLRLPKPSSRAASALIQILIAAGALAWSLLLRVYLGTAMILLVALFYFLEGSKTISTLGGVMLTMPQFPAPFGMLFVHWFEPDEEKDAKLPNLFYILYPAQLLVFGLTGLLLRSLG